MLSHNINNIIRISKQLENRGNVVSTQEKFFRCPSERELSRQSRGCIRDPALGIRWSQCSPSRERVYQPARWDKKDPTGFTVNPSRRTVLERLTFSRPVSSGLTNRERDGYEITIALGSPLQLSASVLTSPSRVSSAPCASQSKVKRFIDIKSIASSAIGASKSISRPKIPLDRKANRVVHGSGYYGQLLVSIARDSFVAETKGAKSVSFTDQTDIWSSSDFNDRLILVDCFYN